jgi:ACR3 family arsenite efflux pump ArsB
MTLNVNGAPVVSIPIAVCLFFMMYPIMVKINFAEVVTAGKSVRPVLLTLFVNWCVKPFTMLAISTFFLGTLFLGFIGPEATDLVKLPFGLDLAEGAQYGAGQVVIQDGVKLLEVPLWRSYLAGCILLGVAPCTAMVLVWGYLAKGSDAHTLVMVALNSLTMLVLLFSFKGEVILANPLTILWIAIPLTVQTLLIFAIAYAFAKVMGLRYADAAPTAMIGASNHFEVAIASAVMLFGLSSGAALATVVGVLIEVPLMLALVRFCLSTQSWFPAEPLELTPDGPIDGRAR